MSCEVPDHVQQVLNQLMVLLGAVAPVSSDEVIAIGVRQLRVASSGEISWNAVRDALIREITFGGAKCPTKEVCRLLENVVVEAESRNEEVVWSSAQAGPPTIPNDSYPLQLIVVPGEEIQRHLPETLHVEATGQGGRDLQYPIPWDISIRSDKEGQSVYGPSLARMEETVDVPGIFGGLATVQVTALGRSKASHEFLVLHYFGLDSAKHWDALLSEVLPAVQLPGASARRATGSGNV